jgi:ribonuclease P protein component
MLAKKLRLTTEEFDTVMRIGTPHRISFGKIALLLLPKTEIDKKKYPKFSVVAPKKNFGKAHERNEIKRFVYRVLSDRMSELSIPVYMVLTIYKDKKTLEMIGKKNIADEIVSLFKSLPRDTMAQ